MGHHGKVCAYGYDSAVTQGGDIPLRHLELRPGVVAWRVCVEVIESCHFVSIVVIELSTKDENLIFFLQQTTGPCSATTPDNPSVPITKRKVVSLSNENVGLIPAPKEV
jgi:hypothetical protein